MNLSATSGVTRTTSAFTLMETVVAMLVAILFFGGILTAYMQSARFAEWSGYSLAAQALGIQQLEQVRAAKWDTQATPEVDETSPFLSTNNCAALDVPVSGTNELFATNFITVVNVPDPGNAGVRLKMIHVDTVWSYRGELFTNTIATYLAPDR